MNKMHGGKGDKPRPLGVSMEEFDRNFDAIFGNKKVKVTVYGVEIEKTQEEWDKIFDKDLNKEKEKDIEVSLDIENDSQEVTVTKTWKF